MEEEKPYWMNLRGGTAFSGELRYDLENYFPEAHYKLAIDEAFEKQAEQELVPDGGRAQYYWSGEQGLIYHTKSTEFVDHTETEGEIVDPFFNSVDEVEHYQRA